MSRPEDDKKTGDPSEDYDVVRGSPEQDSRTAKELQERKRVEAAVQLLRQKIEISKSQKSSKLKEGKQPADKTYDSKTAKAQAKAEEFCRRLIRLREERRVAKLQANALNTEIPGGSDGHTLTSNEMQEDEGQKPPVVLLVPNGAKGMVDFSSFILWPYSNCADTRMMCLRGILCPRRSVMMI